jgi:1-phosphatidylinositol-3-phosphate 5-kinase
MAETLMDPTPHFLQNGRTNQSSLTTFPNPFADEPEPGLIPSLFTKVKATFAAASSSSSLPVKNVDKGLEEQTEAQAIAEAAKRTYLGGRQSASGLAINLPPALSVTAAENNTSAKPSPTTSITPASSGSRSTTAASSVHSHPTSSYHSQAPPRRLVPPGERQWRPTGAAPAQVTVSPVTSVTTTITAHGHNSSPANDDLPPMTTVLQKPPLRAHFGLQIAVGSSSSRPLNHLHHAHSRSFGGRPRRSSIATIPDSPSSVSLSAMIAANAELSGNATHIPGFPIHQDDTRSERSLGFGKKTNSVSRLIRRMRGEGLSKHYWMADEHCKECYDCRSVRVFFSHLILLSTL